MGCGQSVHDRYSGLDYGAGIRVVVALSRLDDAMDASKPKGDRNHFSAINSLLVSLYSEFIALNTKTTNILEALNRSTGLRKVCLQLLSEEIIESAVAKFFIFRSLCEVLIAVERDQVTAPFMKESFWLENGEAKTVKLLLANLSGKAHHFAERREISSQQRISAQWIVKAIDTILGAETSEDATNTNGQLQVCEEKAYVEALQPLRFATIDLCDRIKMVQASHSLYVSSTNAVMAGQRGRLARIAKEMDILKDSLPVEYGSAIFVRADEERVDVMKALIIGPEGTPYANGCFEFDILLPVNYPDAPPRVRFLTTGGGTVQFNPNLYHSGYVCLSLLGTWSGPGWEPDKSTLLQVLVSLQALVFVQQPYYNEPEYAWMPNSPASAAYDRNVRRLCIRYAMRDALKTPSVVFGEVVRAHFLHKRMAVLTQLAEWAQELPETFQPVAAELRDLLAALT